MQKTNSILLTICAALTVGAIAQSANAQSLSAAQVIDKNLAARGGSAWKSVDAITWTGKMDVGSGNSTARTNRFMKNGQAPTSRKDLDNRNTTEAADDKQVQVPFSMTVQRPNSVRFELVFAGKTAVQVYDGKQGWKVRPFLNRDDAEPFSADELKVESRTVVDGPLFDYAAKGTKAELAGMDTVDGHKAYKLKLTLKDGTVQHIWVDAQSFLDVKIEGTPRRMDDKMHAVYTYQRDFRNVHGITVPFTMETQVDGYPDKHKMLIENVVVNPKLTAATFAKPAAAAAGVKAPDKSSHGA